MGQKSRTYECKKCLKEVLVLKEGRHPGAPFCCGLTMKEVRSMFP